MDDDLVEYRKAAKILYEEIAADKLTYKEAHERCKMLWKLIPYNIDINPVALNQLMKEKYSNDPDWTYSKTFTIFVD